MENINFIPANELPVAEGDEVNVLCLENGEMKQKPAANLGGGSSELAIVFNQSKRELKYVTPGIYAAIRKACMEDVVGLNLKVWEQHDDPDEDFRYSGIEINHISQRKDVNYIVLDFGGYGLSIYENGEVEYIEYD